MQSFLRNGQGFLLILLFFVLHPSSTCAQYFFKDIWNTQQLNKESLKLRKGAVTLIDMKSFEDDGSPSPGFFCQKKIDRNFTISETKAKSYITGESSTVTNYNVKGQVVKVTDSTSSSVNQTEYLYDQLKIKSVSTYTRSFDGTPGISEIHSYVYSASGQLEKMIRTKMGVDYSTIIFSVDKNGNVIDEQEVIKNETAKKFLYYYDENNRLTDVVHNSERAKRLLPDYVYEYDEKGNISQLISTDESTSNYFIWKYDYNNQNLRITEKCYSKERRLLGIISYDYK